MRPTASPAIHRLAFLGMLALTVAAPARAQMNTAVQFQSRLLSGGAPANGPYDYLFTLYDAETGGNAIGTPIQKTPTLTGGVFTLTLDFGNVFDGRQLWVELQERPAGTSNARTVLTPRVRFAAVPYALTAYQLALPYSVSLNNAGPLLSLTNGQNTGSVLSAVGHGPNPTVHMGNDAGPDFRGDGNAGAGQAAIEVHNFGAGEALLAEVDSVRFTGPVIAFRARVEQPDRAPDISPEQFEAGAGETYAAATYAVVGDPPRDPSATSNPPLSIGVISGGDIGTWGYSPSGVGIRGQSPAAYGVYGTTDSLDGSPGVSSAVAVGGSSTNGKAISGQTQSGVAVYGHSSSGSGKAGVFDGDVQINGTLTATSKNFRIDHPLDPERRVLLHASVESSAMLDLYTGNAILDSRGEAIVELPPWFEALNRDFSYQLTSVGAPAIRLYVAQEIRDHRFRIAGGEPGGKVSWLVTGVRHDPQALAHPLIVEQDKPAGGPAANGADTGVQR